MNQVIISGTLGRINDEDIFTRGDGATVVDSYIYKTYNKDGKTFDSHFYFTISGSKADKLLEHYQEGDRVLLTGKMATRIDNDGHYWVVIVAHSISKLDTQETDI